MKEVSIYTDGSSLDAKKYNLAYEWWGGSGAVLICGDLELELSEHRHNGTNQQTEVYAVIMALRKLKQRCKVMVYTDSMYVIKGATEWANGWIKRDWLTTQGAPVKNKDLWIDLLTETSKHDLMFQWVKGHSGDKYNDLADELAVRASTKLKNATLNGEDVRNGNL